MLVGVMLFMVVNALGELACVFPIQGSFSIYSTRFLHPSWGFAMGWNYALQWVVTLPTELTSAVLVIAVSSLLRPVFTVTDPIAVSIGIPVFLQPSGFPSSSLGRS